MKNLYKKIGALVLAGMVVAGGFAASGAQSFAGSKSSSQKWEQLEDQRDIAKEKVEKMINDSKYKKYKVIASFFVREMLLEKGESYRYSVNKFRRGVARISNKERLEKLLSLGFNAVMIQHDGMFHLISDSNE